MTREPLAIRAAVVAALAAIVNVAVAFGWDLSVDQLGALNAAIGLVASAVIVVWTRGKVTPVQDPHDDAGQPLVPLGREDY